VYGCTKLHLINTETKKVVPLTHNDFPADNQIVLAFKDDFVVLGQSSITSPPHNVAIKLDFENAKGDTELLVKSAKWCKFNEAKTERAPDLFNTLKTVVKKDIKISNAEGHLYYSEGTTTKELIAIIHGGPHASFPDCFNYTRSYNTTSLYFLAAYPTLLINYRGSLGYGQKYVQSLLGHVGDHDVIDCMECIEEACK